MPRLPAILVVDDDPLVARALARTLTRPDRRVLTVTDPREALTVLDSEPIDLVISDKEMPGMSGLALLDRVREEHPGVTRVLLTAHASLDSALAAINEHQVFRYVTKPWDPVRLEEVVVASLAHASEARRRHEADQADSARQRMLEQLGIEHPGLLDVGTGRHVPALDALADHVEDIVQELIAGGTAEIEREQLEDTCLLAGAVVVADAILLVPLRHPTIGIRLDPDGDRTAVAAVFGGQHYPLVSLPRRFGEAVAARFAALAGLDPVAPGPQLGRLEALLGAATTESVVAMSSGETGVSLELRRLTDVRTPAGLRPGDELLDRYRLVEQLGTGGTATVYRAVHLQLDRPCAIKVLRDAAVDDPVACGRLLREAQTASRLRHPGVVETLDAGYLPDGRPYLAMELIEAETLSERLKRGPLAPAEAVAIARDVAEALGVAHAAGVIHRDVKPANVFVASGGRAKLCDFGAAKLLDAAGPALTRTGTTIGTPYYMSPEHVLGHAVDGRSDLYALGCVLFEMIAGHPPFRGGGMREVLNCHLQADIPTPDSPHGPVPPGLVEVVRKAMAKRPSARFQTAAELVAALDHAVGRGVVRAVRSPPRPKP